MIGDTMIGGQHGGDGMMDGNDGAWHDDQMLRRKG
jgi:hypothetical protein